MQLSWCDCSDKAELRESKQPLSKDRMFLTFLVDRPANIAWYQGAAFVFASATGHKISSFAKRLNRKHLSNTRAIPTKMREGF